MCLFLSLVFLSNEWFVNVFNWLNFWSSVFCVFLNRKFKCFLYFFSFVHKMKNSEKEKTELWQLKHSMVIQRFTYLTLINYLILNLITFLYKCRALLYIMYKKTKYKHKSLKLIFHWFSNCIFHVSIDIQVFLALKKFFLYNFTFMKDIH